jgi:hypothetical protein
LGLNYEDAEILESGDNLYVTFNLSEYSYNSILSIDIGGLNYEEAVSQPTTAGQFYEEDGKLTIHSSLSCGARPGLLINLTLNVGFTSSLDCKRFNLSSYNLAYVDYLSHGNRVFYPSTEVVSGTLIYNSVNKVALCLL